MGCVRDDFHQLASGGCEQCEQRKRCHGERVQRAASVAEKDGDGGDGVNLQNRETDDQQASCRRAAARSYA